jgi:hypothetical protein
VTYQGKNVALLTTVVDPLGSYWTASVVPISPGGLFETPRRVPLLADLPERPRACSERDRAETPRVVAPALPGPVREILFEEPGGQLVSFRSGRAILYGTLDDPCVAAFEAESNDTAADRGVHYRMLWFPGPSQVSWLFREESTGGARRLGARPIACVEPSARKRPTPAGASALE